MGNDPTGDSLRKAEALLHPVRLRIVKVLQTGSKTPGQIAALLPEVAQATLYRHIARLEEAGVITVIERRQVHGTVERVFDLIPERAVFNHQELSSVPPDEKIVLARLFFGELIALFERYFRNRSSDLSRDHVVMYEQAAHLTPEEAQKVREEMRNLMDRYVSNPPNAERRPYSLTVVSVPEVAPEAAQGRPAKRKKSDD
ncbi:MAG: helix-turn-helix domain-containing protein [Capsulimonadales bacterium]|nr:helix-turn-helix domain-containing protein [Capsulimonadales bacterium]